MPFSNHADPITTRDGICRAIELPLPGTGGRFTLSRHSVKLYLFYFNFLNKPKSLHVSERGVRHGAALLFNLCFVVGYNGALSNSRSLFHRFFLFRENAGD